MPLVIVESGNDGNHRSPRLQLHGRPDRPPLRRIGCSLQCPKTISAMTHD
jgi:hypothetical protein